MSRISSRADQEVIPILSENEKLLALDSLRRKGITIPFLLCLSQWEPRFHLNNVLRAFAWLKEERSFPGRLVVAQTLSKPSDVIHGLVKQLKMEREVLFMQKVSGKELQLLLNLAQAVIYVPSNEDEALPVALALSCGAALITSNDPVCLKMAGDAALMCDPCQPLHIAEALDRVLKNPELKKELQKRALKRARGIGS